MFFENLAGFLFKPSRTTVENLENKDFLRSHKASQSYVIYSAILLGVTLWYFIFYPEPLYYGITEETPHAQIPIVTMSNPLFLLAFVLIGLIIFWLYNHIIVGIINYFILKGLSKEKNTTISFKSYLTFHGYTITPILFMVPVMVFRIFFFERMFAANFQFPFFDMSGPTIVFLVILLGFVMWKWIIELGVNRKLFKLPLIKTCIPWGIHVGILFLSIYISSLILPPILTDIVINLII
ncbi:MAG: hypothetical protein ACFFCS_21730 [Candidatus Hodarchaeota archaeon]